jgi:hypothetical protein
MLAPMPRRARRPAGTVRLAAVVLGALLTTSCGGVGQPVPYDPSGIDGLEIPTPSPDPADFTAGVDNPWFPLQAGDTWRYVVEQDGRRLGTVVVEVQGSARVAGVDATAVRTRVSGDPERRGTVTRYYAQDRAGNVWLLGEDAPDRTWRAGVGGAEGGVVMPANPRVGDGWVRASVPGTDEQTVRVDAPGAVPPAGVTAGTTWTTEDDGSSRTQDVYARDLGLVESVVLDSGLTTRLVSPAPE